MARKFQTRAMELLGRIVEYNYGYGRMPTSTELQHRLGGSRGALVARLKTLESRGYIRRPKGAAWCHGTLTGIGWIAGEKARHQPAAPYIRRAHKPVPHAHLTGTKFKGQVHDAPETPGVNRLRVLKEGHMNKKLGRRVLRGRWEGAYIYQLSLEERATCPETCKVWSTCYGNNMPLAIRYNANEALMQALKRDLRFLDSRRRPYVVRLHGLGDFPTRSYAQWWRDQLDKRPYLRIFGYTAHTPGSAIGKVWAEAPWERCAIRFSGSRAPTRGSIVSAAPHLNVASFPCPVQIGTSASCGACTACWETEKTVRFSPH